MDRPQLPYSKTLGPIIAGGSPAHYRRRQPNPTRKGPPTVCKWIYKIKTHFNGSIERYKTRLVAKDFTQEYVIDYEETFTLVACISSVHALLAIAAANKWDIFQMDVKNTFLNGDLSEEVYMQHSPGLSVNSNKVCQL